MVLAGLIGLAGCAGAPGGGGPFRQADAPIYSMAAPDEARLAGTWAQVGGFGGDGCAPGEVTFAGSPGALRIRYRLCLSGQRVGAEGPLVARGPGRYAAPGLADDLWLLWMDEGARTAVFGTPSGSFGFVLNRGGTLPGDRARALRDILAWNGYDPAALVLW